jgi:hypothetical protein
VRAARFRNRRNAPDIRLDTGDDPAQDDAEDAMTPRGTKYWSSGAIR